MLHFTGSFVPVLYRLDWSKSMPPNLWQFCLIIAVMASAAGLSVSTLGTSSMRMTFSASLGVAVVKAFLRAEAVHNVPVWTLAILPTAVGFGFLGYLLGERLHRRTQVTKASHY